MWSVVVIILKTPWFGRYHHPTFVDHVETSVKELLRMERILAVYRCCGSEASMTDGVESSLGVLSMSEAFRLIYHERLVSCAGNLTHLKTMIPLRELRDVSCPISSIKLTLGN
jgi:hypothetical protein